MTSNYLSIGYSFYPLGRAAVLGIITQGWRLPFGPLKITLVAASVAIEESIGFVGD